MPAVTIPILPSADFDVTSSFWGGFGFEEIGRWPGDYLIVRHLDLSIELHFWSNPTVDRWTNDVACYVRFDTPDEARECHSRWSDVTVEETASSATRMSSASCATSGGTARPAACPS
jgi:hypothetical protein